MHIGEKIKCLLAKLGQVGNLVNDGISYPLFIQPMRYKNKMYIDSVYTKIGVVDESCYLYIGPYDVNMYEDRSPVLCVDGAFYNCVKTELVHFGNQPAYYWAILRLVR